MGGNSGSICYAGSFVSFGPSQAIRWLAARANSLNGEREPPNAGAGPAQDFRVQCGLTEQITNKFDLPGKGEKSAS